MALLYGDEWPQVKVKTLATREEKFVPISELLAYLQAHLILVILSEAIAKSKDHAAAPRDNATGFFASLRMTR